MFRMRKMIWSRLKLHFRKQSRDRKENANGMMSKPDYVNEEYMEAIRTDSFVEMYSKVQRQLARKSLDKLSSSSSLTPRVHLSDIVEPSQEILTDIVEGSELHQFLTCFFQISYEASKICELLLKSIDKTRANYSAIRSVTKQLKSISSDDDYTDDRYNKIYGSLAAFSSLSNPLSSVNSAQFQELHDNLYLSLDIFTSKCRKIRRRRKFIGRCKRIAGATLVAVYSALAITLIVLAIHSVVGMVAAPGLIAASVALLPNQCKGKQVHKTIPLERLEAQLETAAKGVYLLINDFDTMSRLVMRLNSEMEHSKFVADLCLRRRTNETLKEAARELQINQTELMNQLEDLEEHVYLCILNINRSRRILVEKMVAG